MNIDKKEELLIKSMDSKLSNEERQLLMTMI